MPGWPSASTASRAGSSSGVSPRQGASRVPIQSGASRLTIFPKLVTCHSLGDEETFVEWLAPLQKCHLRAFDSL